MRKVSSYLLMSLDGVVEAPDKFARPELFGDIIGFLRENIADQDTVLLGRKTYEEWSGFWPSSDFEPFASFINKTPKLVMSQSLSEVNWSAATLIKTDLKASVGKLKAQPGRTIGVHGSISLVHSLVQALLLDELCVVQFPVIAGQGRRLGERLDKPFQLDLKSSRKTESGLHYLIYGKH